MYLRSDESENFSPHACANIKPWLTLIDAKIFFSSEFFSCNSVGKILSPLEQETWIICGKWTFHFYFHWKTKIAFITQRCVGVIQKSSWDFLRGFPATEQVFSAYTCCFPRKSLVNFLWCKSPLFVGDDFARSWAENLRVRWYFWENWRDLCGKCEGEGGKTITRIDRVSFIKIHRVESCFVRRSASFRFKIFQPRQDKVVF